MKLISWNVNGLRACIKKGLADFLKKEKAEVYCFQETKLSSQVSLFDNPLIDEGYISFSASAKKAGYSGVTTHTKPTPVSFIEGIGQEQVDREGRVLTLEFNEFYLVNSYFPHTQRELKRLDYKLEFNSLFENFCNKLQRKKPLVICGDFNVAHKEIDLRNPRENTNNAGFTTEERKWFDKFLKEGYLDTFREFTKDGGHYTWWTYRNNARERNIGWRIDYFLVSRNLDRKVKSSKILKDVMGSDHCPIMLEIDL